MNFLILCYYVMSIPAMFYLALLAGEISTTKVIKMYHTIILIIFLPSSLIVLMIVVLCETAKKLVFHKTYSKIVHFMNKPAIDFNKKNKKEV